VAALTSEVYAKQAELQRSGRGEGEIDAVNIVREGRELIRELLRHNLGVDPATVKITEEQYAYRIEAEKGTSSDLTRGEIEDYLTAKNRTERVVAKDKILNKLRKVIKPSGSW